MSRQLRIVTQTGSKQIFTIASIATYVMMRLAAHLTTSPTLTAMGQSLLYSNPGELVLNILLL
jgi:hypothetical protein